MRVQADFTPCGKTAFRVQAGEEGMSYTFRVRAIDNVGNTSAWVESETATVQTTVTKYYYLAGQRVAMRQGDALTYLYGDHLGSTSLITNTAGAVVAETRYLPYGQVYWQWGASQTDFGFTGQRLDGFGLMDYNARYYDPLLARFISPDMDQTIGSTIDPDVDVITCITFQIQFLGRQITVSIDYQPEEQVIHKLPWITYHDSF